MLAEPNASMKSHEPSPTTIEVTAPVDVARFQYKPATSGTKAPTSVTL